jgi:hypothetical protein
VVQAVHWRLSATDSVNTRDAYSVFGLGEPLAASFIAYSDLTLDTVVSWIEAGMGADAVARLKAGLDQQLEELANPTVIYPDLPWAPVVAVTTGTNAGGSV